MISKAASIILQRREEVRMKRTNSDTDTQVMRESKKALRVNNIFMTETKRAKTNCISVPLIISFLLIMCLIGCVS